MKRPTLEQVKRRLAKIEKELDKLKIEAPSAKWLKRNNRYKKLKADRELFKEKLRILREIIPIRIRFPNWMGQKDIVIKPMKKRR